MPSRAAVIRVSDFDNSEKRDISNILQKNMEYFSEETKKRVLEFLGFLEHEDESELFPLRCKEIKGLEDQISEIDEVNSIIWYVRNFRWHSFKATSTNRIWIAINQFLRSDMSFEILADKILTIELLTYHDFLDIIHSDRFKNWEEIDFKLLKKIIAKLQNPSVSRESRKIWIGELDILARCAVRDSLCWDQSNYLQQIGKVFWITPDEWVMKSLEILRERTP